MRYWGVSGTNVMVLEIRWYCWNSVVGEQIGYTEVLGIRIPSNFNKN